LSDSDLSQSQKVQLQKFLQNHRYIFATNLSELGKSYKNSHKISTVSDTPVRMTFYLQNPKMQQETDK